MKYIICFLASLLFFNMAFAERISPHYIGSLGIPKKVFGQYPRMQISDTSSFITRITGHIETFDSSCTGTLISAQHILTAAHCVYDRASKSWATDVKFYPGRYGNDKTPYGMTHATKFFIHKNYIISENFKEYDFAVIELESKIGERLGWAGLEVSSVIVKEFKAQILGYPGDQDHGTLWSVECPASISMNNEVNYLCDTYSGMSGAALRSKSRPNYVIGIHSFGLQEVNGGWLINEKRYDLIDAWRTGKNIGAETITYNNKQSSDRFDKIYFKNECSDSLDLIVLYKGLDGAWTTEGPFEFAPDETGYIFDTKNAVFYFYAETTDGTVWAGQTQVKYNGKMYGMLKYVSPDDTFGEQTVSLGCQ